jgi:hypothetical protein
LKGSLKELFCEPVQFYGTGRYTKRIATAIMKDGTRFMILAIGPAVVFDPQPWISYQVDISQGTNDQEVFKLEVDGKTGKWEVRDQMHNESILGLFGWSLAEWRKKKIRERMGWK